MDREQKTRYLTEMMNTQGWKIFIEQLDKEINILEKELLRDGMKEQDMIDSRNSIRNYTLYDLMALLRKHLINFKEIPQRIMSKSEGVYQKDMTPYL